MEPRFLILETSCQVGQIALAQGPKVLAVRRLDDARRHARDLIPALGDLLAAQGWKVGKLTGVIASRGPGSYTGLRVGIMIAKTLAYATGCTLLAIDTFPAIARQAPQNARRIDVLADAQKNKVYVQKFARPDCESAWHAQSSLAIQTFTEWLTSLEDDASVWISGPGIRGHEERLRHRSLVDESLREPWAESLLHLGLKRFHQGERDDLWQLEPLYLRPSAAEEKLLKKNNQLSTDN